MTDPASSSSPLAHDRRRWAPPAIVRMRPRDARIGANPINREGAFAFGS